MEDSRAQIEDTKAKVRASRLFVAIGLPNEVKDQIEKAQAELRRALTGEVVRWTKREQFHLTLKFLGNVEVSRVPELTEMLRKGSRNFAVLRLRAKGIGFFPDSIRPRVVWAGVQDEKSALPRLQEAIEAASRNFTNEEPEGRFAGHVTLGRIQRIKRPHVESLSKLALGMADRFFGEWVANAGELIRSELGSTGSHYTTVAAIPFSSEP